MSTLVTAHPAAVDLRTIAPRERPALVFTRFDELLAGQSMQLVDDQDPRPLRSQLQDRALGPFEWTLLASGPDLWRVRITRVAAQPMPAVNDACCSGGACCG